MECTAMAQEIILPVRSFKGNSLGELRESLGVLCGFIFLSHFHKTFDITLGWGYLRRNGI